MCQQHLPDLRHNTSTTLRRAISQAPFCCSIVGSFDHHKKTQKYTQADGSITIKNHVNIEVMTEKYRNTKTFNSDER